MTPTRSVRCDHPLDEWCDRCYMPEFDRQLVAMLDEDPADPTTSPAFERLVDDVAAAYGVEPDDVRAEFVGQLAAVTRAHTPPTEPCRNGRHAHTVRQNSVCDTPTPPPPAIDRAVGAAACVAATSVVVTVAGVWAAAEWVNGPGRSHAAAARQRAHDTWCRWLG